MRIFKGRRLYYALKLAYGIEVLGIYIKSFGIALGKKFYDRAIKEDKEG